MTSGWASALPSSAAIALPGAEAGPASGQAFRRRLQATVAMCRIRSMHLQL
jgi:hypothetical protein